jgi:hypothetical protein
LKFRVIRSPAFVKVYMPLCQPLCGTDNWALFQTAHIKYGWSDRILAKRLFGLTKRSTGTLRRIYDFYNWVARSLYTREFFPLGYNPVQSSWLSLNYMPLYPRWHSITAAIRTSNPVCCYIVSACHRLRQTPWCSPWKLNNLSDNQEFPCGRKYLTQAELLSAY